MGPTPRTEKSYVKFLCCHCITLTSFFFFFLGVRLVYLLLKVIQKTKTGISTHACVLALISLCPFAFGNCFVENKRNKEKKAVSAIYRRILQIKIQNTTLIKI